MNLNVAKGNFVECHVQKTLNFACFGPESHPVAKVPWGVRIPHSPPEGKAHRTDTPVGCQSSFFCSAYLTIPNVIAHGSAMLAR